jgi:hypothetical protein
VRPDWPTNFGGNVLVGINAAGIEALVMHSKVSFGQSATITQ